MMARLFGCFGPVPQAAPAARPAPAAQPIEETMSPQGARRLVRALRTLQDPAVAEWCKVAPREDNLRIWDVRMYFRDDAMHQALVKHKLPCATLEVTFPADYPHRAPKVRVVSPQLKHVADGQAGVYGGALCLEVLHRWDPTTTEEPLLKMIYAALAQSKVKNGHAYSSEAYDEGARIIRSRHPEWRPAPKAP